MATEDGKIVGLVSATSLRGVADVVSLLQSLDANLADDDGLKWFNLLYWKVTEGVLHAPLALPWENPAWLERLDVNFAGLYFRAITDWTRAPNRVARCWLPLFEARRRRGVMHIQFALAGMNAHINHDLPLALVQTAREQRVAPQRGTREHRDFERVNDILDAVQEQAKHLFTTGIIGDIDKNLGRVDDLLANWSIRKARDTGWSNAEILWHCERVPALHNDFVVNLDRLVSLSSRGLLVPVANQMAPARG